MKILISASLLLFLIINTLNADDVKIPFKKENIKAIYKINNGNLIYIQSFERGDRIWELEKNSKELIEISIVFNFIALAEKCEFIKKDNIYFAQNREYWFGGGAVIDNAQIRIFELYDKTPWRDSDLGITPDIEYAKQWCKFYKKL
tara:strand:+ start:43 stop:480 length:438 start_codon:yes stop_codon:yes gene_type:complete